MKRKLWQAVLGLMILPIAGYVCAHPSWGLVINEEGDLFFSDLEHVWVLTSEGEVEKIIPHVHTHDLQLGPDGRLWGSDSRYRQARDDWRIRLWSADSGFDLRDEIPWQDDFKWLNGAIFARVGSWIYFPYENHIYRRRPSSDPELCSSLTFQRICTVIQETSGSILISDSGEDGKLYRLDTFGRLKLIAENLKDQPALDPPFEEDRYDLFYGMHVDYQYVYLCNSGGRKILKVDRHSGISELFYKSTAPWYPTALTMDNGDVFILEMGWTQTNIGPRILQLQDDGQYIEIYNHQTGTVNRAETVRETEGKPKLPHWFVMIAFLVLSLTAVIVYGSKNRRFVEGSSEQGI